MRHLIFGLLLTFIATPIFSITTAHAEKVQLLIFNADDAPDKYGRLDLILNEKKEIGSVFFLTPSGEELNFSIKQLLKRERTIYRYLIFTVLGLSASLNSNGDLDLKFRYIYNKKGFPFSETRHEHHLLIRKVNGTYVALDGKTQTPVHKACFRLNLPEGVKAYKDLKDPDDVLGIRCIEGT